MKNIVCLLISCFALVHCSNSDNPPVETPLEPISSEVDESKVVDCDIAQLSQTAITPAFDVFNTSASGWIDVKNYLDGIATSNSALSYNALTSRTIDSKLDANNKFRGGVLGINNIIFLMPQSFTIKNIYAFNPNTDYLCKFKPQDDINGVWAGGVTLPDGRIISFPIGGTDILEIDPINLVAKVVGQTEGQFGGQILANNGFIYAIPSSADHILKFNPNNYTSTKITGLPDGGAKWYSAALAPNGKIYGIPLNTDRVLQVNPTTDTYKLIGDSYPEAMKWAGSILGANGKIYGAPDDATSILEIDPVAETTTLIGSLSTDKQKWSFGFLGPDNNIYFAPDWGDSIMQFNPHTQDIQYLGNLPGADKWNGVVQANGKYYAIPDSDSNILEISFPGFTTHDSFIYLSPFHGKY